MKSRSCDMPNKIVHGYLCGEYNGVNLGDILTQAVNTTILVPTAQ